MGKAGNPHEPSAYYLLAQALTHDSRLRWIPFATNVYQ